MQQRFFSFMREYGSEVYKKQPKISKKTSFEVKGIVI